MGIELAILKELATITATSCEAAALRPLILGELEDPDFWKLYDDLHQPLADIYRVVVEMLESLIHLDHLEAFEVDFAETAASFADKVSPEISRCRKNAELAAELYIEFRKRRETKTSYPLLKHAFGRLHDLIDKWLDNDALLVMSIDVAFKGLAGILGELRKASEKDPGDAFRVYTSITNSLTPYVKLVQEKSALLIGEERARLSA